MPQSLNTTQKYYINHREIIKKRSQEHYNLNKAAINNKRLTPVTCVCGSVVCHASMRRHLYTQTHKEYIRHKVRFIKIDPN